MAAAQNLIGQVGMYSTKGQVLFHGLYLKPNTTFSRPNSVPRSVSEFLKPAPWTRARFRFLRRNSPSSTQTQPCMQARGHLIAVVTQPGPTRSVAVQMGSQAKQCNASMQQVNPSMRPSIMIWRMQRQPESTALSGLMLPWWCERILSYRANSKAGSQLGTCSCR